MDSITSPGTSVFSLCDHVRTAALDLHRHLRHGHLEKVYETGLAIRLRKQGLTVSVQYPIQVRDADDSILGDYFADMVVEGQLILEIKAVRALAPEHIAQLLGYLRAAGWEHGLLINFGAPRLEIRQLVLSRPGDPH